MVKPSKALKRANTARGKRAVTAVQKDIDARKLAKSKGKETAALTTLKPIAKEINTRLDKAEKLTSDAFDHRLSAAIRLEDARKLCQKNNIKFKTWAEANVKESYETVRKLAAVGASDNPALALEDMRIDTKKRVAKSREKSAVLRNTTAKSAGGTGPAPSTPSRTPWEIADDMVASLDEKSQITLVESRAYLIGRKVITAEDNDILNAAKAPGKVSASVVSIKKAFRKMKASDKMKFLTWAATEVGATMESCVGNGHDNPIPDKGGVAIPESMRRGGPTVA